jgi:hypothetical protein
VTSLREVETAARDGALGDLIGTLRPDPFSRSLATALRVDLAAIVADPALTLQTVWARGHSSPALRRLLDGWRAENAGRPWARALRPPLFPLSGPLEEEYRGDFHDADGISLTDDTVTVFQDTSAVALDRATGRVSPATAPARSSWTLDRRVGAGRCRVVGRDSGAELLDVRVNDDDRYAAVATAGDAVFAGGWCGDYDGVVVGLDAPTATARWRWEEPGAYVATVSCTPDGARVLAFATDGRLFVLDGATGAVVHGGHTGATVGALDPAGSRLATVADSVVRVWSLDRLGETPTGVPGSGSGFAYAMWSPDGSRLLTGSALCDGTDGRLVAVLPMDGAGYLEGGPPAGARAVGRTGVVEFSPLRGMTMWDAASGAPVARDPARAYSIHRDLLWIDPDARLYVHASRVTGAATLLRVDDGTPVADLGDERVSTVTWAPDSSRFVTTHDDGRVRVWSAGGALLQTADEADGPDLPERQHPYDAHHEAGHMVLDPDDPALPGYRIACDEPLIPGPTGSHWASPTVHVALEPAR